MAISHQPTDSNDQQPIKQYTEALRQRYADMQSADDSTQGVPTSNSLFALSDLDSMNDEELPEVNQDRLDSNRSNDVSLYDDHSNDNMLNENENENGLDDDQLDNDPSSDDRASIECIAPSQSDSLAAEGIMYEGESKDDNQSTATEFGTNTSPLPSGLVVSSRSISPTGPATASQIRRVLSGEMNVTAPSVVQPSILSSPDPHGLVPPPSTPEKPATPSTLETTQDLSNYEIAKIIRDAIDNLPPGSLVPLGESMFAPGSKRNLAYKASLRKEQAAGKQSPTSFNKHKQQLPLAASKETDGSLTNMSSHNAGSAKKPGDARVVDWNDPQRLVEANKPEQTDIVFSNRFSPLSGYGDAEKYSRATQKSLVGPGLYSKSTRPLPKEPHLDDPTEQVHTYSPGPGIVLTFKSVARRPLVDEMPKSALNPGSASFVPSPSPPAQVTKPQQLPPHLRPAQDLDITQPSKESMAETHAGKEFDEVMKADTLEALHKDQPAVKEAIATVPAIQSSQEDDHTPSSPYVEENIFSATNKVAPHLRKNNPPTPKDDLLVDSAMHSASTPSPLSSIEKLVPQLRKPEVPNPQEDIRVDPAIFSASTLLPLSSTEKLAPHLKNPEVPNPQEDPLIGLAKSSVSTPSPLSSIKKLAPHLRKFEVPNPQEAHPVSVAKPKETLPVSITKPKEALPISIAKPKEVLPVSIAKPKEGLPDPIAKTKEVLPVSIAKSKEETLLPLSSSTEKALPHMRKAETSGQSSTEGAITDLKEALYFAAWPKSEARDTPGMYSCF